MLLFVVLSVINYVAYCGFICLIHPVALCFRIMYGEQARYFDMEVSPRIKHKKRGLLSMVNNGSGMHGSQVKYFFYIYNPIQISYRSCVRVEVAILGCPS